jgi:hypothetical protein
MQAIPDINWIEHTRVNNAEIDLSETICMISTRCVRFETWLRPQKRFPKTFISALARVLEQFGISFLRDTSIGQRSWRERIHENRSHSNRFAATHKTFNNIREEEK